MSDVASPDLQSPIRLTTDIVCAYVVHNHLALSDLPALIASVHGAILGLATEPTPVSSEAAVEKPSAAQIRKSITPAALISFIDGRGYKTLKRHLTKYGLDPASYCARYGLPSDYPMVCADYSSLRTALARQTGLGHKPIAEEEAPPPPAKARRRAQAAVN